jgi:hypothetical protein
LSLAGQGPCGWDALGNPVFGIAPAKHRDQALPNFCVIEALIDTHEMFESREESSYEYLSCALNPFNDPDGFRGMTVSFETTQLSAEAFFEQRLNETSLDGRPEPLVEQRVFGQRTCDVLAIYSYESDSIPSYRLSVKCGSVVTEVHGYNFNPERYFVSPTLQEIVRYATPATK